MTRVRINDVPATEYQRWCRWVDVYNTAAGEVIYYLPRPTAIAAGIVPDLGDWWILDDSRVILMGFDEDGVLCEMTLTDERHEIDRARHWRDIALKLAAR